MSSDPIITAIDVQDSGNVQCWCCDVTDVPDRMVHLGDHPEVNLCLGCAHFVHQRAWEIEDEGRRGAAAFARDRFRNLRAEVIRRGAPEQVDRRHPSLARHVPPVAMHIEILAIFGLSPPRRRR